MTSNHHSIDIQIEQDDEEEELERRSEDTQGSFDQDRSEEGYDDDGLNDDDDGSNDDDDDEGIHDDDDEEEDDDDAFEGIETETVQGQEPNRIHDIGRSNRIHATPTLASDTSKLVREIGGGSSSSSLPGDIYAIWTVSSAKVGCGVAQLRDFTNETYWQSDGAQPHCINIQFSKRVAVSEIAMYLDYSLDESYTPKKISIKSGMTFHDLQEIKTAEFHEPKGWCSIGLIETYGSDPLDLLYDEENVKTRATNRREMLSRPIRTNLLQICILSMHQNGKDTHIRQVKVFGPKMSTIQSFKPTMITASSTNNTTQKFSESFSFQHEYLDFQSAEMSQFSMIR